MTFDWKWPSGYCFTLASRPLDHRKLLSFILGKALSIPRRARTSHPESLVLVFSRTLRSHLHSAYSILHPTNGAGVSNWSVESRDFLSEAISFLSFQGATSPARPRFHPPPFLRQGFAKLPSCPAGLECTPFCLSLAECWITAMQQHAPFGGDVQARHGGVRSRWR